MMNETVDPPVIPMRVSYRITVTEIQDGMHQTSEVKDSGLKNDDGSTKYEWLYGLKKLKQETEVFHTISDTPPDQVKLAKMFHVKAPAASA